MQRILMVLAVGALLVAMVAFTVAPAFAKQATSGPQHTGQTVTYQGNSTNSPQVSCVHGKSGTAC
jgi:hypothetical protein